MKKTIILAIAGGIILLAATSLLFFAFKNNVTPTPKPQDEVTNINQRITEYKTTMNITINRQNYVATLEDNATARAFTQKLPQELEMQELNGNEKYAYLDYALPTKPSVPEQINVGDIMLYGNNCLVIFYKTFTTSYSYTKIGHIDNLPELNDDEIIVKFN